MPSKMKAKALSGALTLKAKAGHLIGLQEYASKEVKTSIAANVLKSMGLHNQKVLLVLDGAQEQVERSFRNIDGVSYTTSLQLNAYDVMCAKHILFVSDAYTVLEKRLTK